MKPYHVGTVVKMDNDDTRWVIYAIQSQGKSKGKQPIYAMLAENDLATAANIYHENLIFVEEPSVASHSIITAHAVENIRDKRERRTRRMIEALRLPTPDNVIQFPGKE